MTTPSVSKKEWVILGMLATARQPMYGLEIVVRSDRQISRGSVYVLLSRMEEKGLVISAEEKEPGRSGIPRRLYEPTALALRLDAARRLEAAR